MGPAPARTLRHVQGGDRVVEVWLVRDADRGGHVEARDADQGHSRQRRQCVNGRGQGRLRVAEVRPQPDVCPNTAHRLLPIAPGQAVIAPPRSATPPRRRASTARRE